MFLGKGWCSTASLQAVRSKASGKIIGYQARVKMRGHLHFATFRTRTQARDWAAPVEVSIKNMACSVCASERAARDPAQRRTVADLLVRYRLYLEASRPHQVAARAKHLDFRHSELGDLLLGELTAAPIVQARDRLRATTTFRGKPRSPADVHRHLATLSHALGVASREWEWIGDNPARRVRKFREPQGRVRFLSEAERERHLTACKQSSQRWMYPVVVLALGTGVREGEIRKPTWDRLDLERGWIALDHTKNS